MYILMNEKNEFFYHQPRKFGWKKEFSKGCWYDDIDIPEKIMQEFARIGIKTYLVEFNVIDYVIGVGLCALKKGYEDNGKKVKL